MKKNRGGGRQTNMLRKKCEIADFNKRKQNNKLFTAIVEKDAKNILSRFCRKLFVIEKKVLSPYYNIPKQSLAGAET